ncbi:MAG: GNAT family N-acetyltransferase [Bacilli bacterium]|nr:GNAT family N-acetyltransferase [Bacilli bacterium]
MVKKMEKKYIPLASFFAEASQNEITLIYTAIENIIGQQLPNAAYLNNSWWKKTKPPATHFLAWSENDYAVKDIELGRSVTFTKDTDDIDIGLSSSTKVENILIIRPVDLDDARAIVRLHQDIDAESDFMLFGKDERKMSVQSIRKLIGEWKKSDTSQMFIGILDGEFAGFVALITGPAPRASHRASVIIGIRKAYYGKKVGTSLMGKAESWAQEVGITRLELSVVEKNESAILLYKKMGYVIEGTRHNSLLINGEYINELYMGKNM